MAWLDCGHDGALTLTVHSSVVAGRLFHDASSEWRESPMHAVLKRCSAVLHWSTTTTRHAQDQSTNSPFILFALYSSPPLSLLIEALPFRGQSSLNKKVTLHDRQQSTTHAVHTWDFGPLADIPGASSSAAPVLDGQLDLALPCHPICSASTHLPHPHTPG